MEQVRLYLAFLLPCLLSAQLIPVGQPLPKGAKPPAVFLNGYQSGCISASTFAGTFGNADAVLQASQIATVFFDNCSVPGNPSIEALGIAFGQFLANLKYTDGTAVPQVDIVVHSMGGLIVRSYLAGKKDVTPAAFAPPATPGIRKIVFLATPHFGSGLGNILGTDTQAAELAVGSQFLFDLNTWNQGTDDLRGIPALAVAGNGGSGSESSIKGFDDGVVTLTSASLGFLAKGLTRVVPTCHTSGIIVTFGYCPSSSPPIAQITDATNVVGQMIVSFLNGDTTWQTLGQAIEANAIASTLGGVNIEAEDLLGARQAISTATVTVAQGTANLSVNSNNVAYSEGLTPNVNEPAQVKLVSGVTLNSTVYLPSTTVAPVVVKPGPVILRVIPAASAVFPLNVTTGAFVAIYGSNLTSGSPQFAASQPYPNQLGDTQVLVNNINIPVQYVSPNQLNVIFSAATLGAVQTSGIAQITVKTGGGQHTVNVMIAPAVPSLFTLDGSGTGPAAATNALTAVIVGTSTPLHASGYVSLYLTGLGLTALQNGLQYATLQPTVTVGGQACNVTYAGRAPGFAGLDQINCQLPATVPTGAAVPVIVNSGGRLSNTATLAIQ